MAVAEAGVGVVAAEEVEKMGVVAVVEEEADQQDMCSTVMCLAALLVVGAGGSIGTGLVPVGGRSRSIETPTSRTESEQPMNRLWGRLSARLGLWLRRRGGYRTPVYAPSR